MLERKRYCAFTGYPYWVRFDGSLTGKVHQCGDGERKLEAVWEDTETYGFLGKKQRKVTLTGWIQDSDLRVCEELSVPVDELIKSLGSK